MAATRLGQQSVAVAVKQQATEGRRLQADAPTDVHKHTTKHQGRRGAGETKWRKLCWMKSGGVSQQFGGELAPCVWWMVVVIVNRPAQICDRIDLYDLC